MLHKALNFYQFYSYGILLEDKFSHLALNSSRRQGHIYNKSLARDKVWCNAMCLDYHHQTHVWGEDYKEYQYSRSTFSSLYHASTSHKLSSTHMLIGTKNICCNSIS